MEKRQLDVAILSDLHLGTYGAKAKEVLNYLKSIARLRNALKTEYLDRSRGQRRCHRVAAIGEHRPDLA